MSQSFGPSQIVRRDSVSTTQTIVIVLVVVIAFLVVSILTCFFYFNRRAKRLQQRGISKRQSWRESLASVTSGFHSPPPVRSDVLDPTQTTTSHEMEEGVSSPAGGVDRNTSVRSVMTLPAYSAVPREDEGILGREGERAGMDTVVEFPETAQEEEDRREEEMESLYQIRQRRRQEAMERSDRRRRRREARARGDHTAIHAIRQESQRAAQHREITGSAALINDHETTASRGRRVSAVSYGDLGVARHDGSRVRANSNDSDRPLLEGSGPFGMAEPFRPWVSREDLGGHRRGGSSISNLSATTYDSEDQSGASDMESDYDASPLSQPGSRRQSHSRPVSQQRSAPRSRAQSRTRSRATSLVPTLGINTDLGDARIPSPDPPHYDVATGEEAPPYTSPVRGKQNDLQSAESGDSPEDLFQLPRVQRLPSIQITVDTPLEPRSAELPDSASYPFPRYQPADTEQR